MPWLHTENATQREIEERCSGLYATADDLDVDICCRLRFQTT